MLLKYSTWTRTTFAMTWALIRGCNCKMILTGFFPFDNSPSTGLSQMLNRYNANIKHTTGPLSKCPAKTHSTAGFVSYKACAVQHFDPVHNCFPPQLQDILIVLFSSVFYPVTSNWWLDVWTCHAQRFYTNIRAAWAGPILQQLLQTSCTHIMKLKVVIPSRNLFREQMYR